MMLTIRDNNMRLNKKTYVYFADAYKCFDRLWLKDCLVELWKAGMREREVMMIYEMNKLAKIVINTPIGNTKEIEVSDIVNCQTRYNFWSQIMLYINTKGKQLGDSNSVKTDT